MPWEHFVLQLNQWLANYDLVHFHDLSTAISPLTVRRIAKRLPTAWTFHDYAAFTGGCIFPLECRKFQTGCGACPQMDLWPLNRSKGIDFTRSVLESKRKTFRQTNIHVIAPCKWMAETAHSSGIHFEQLSIIPYGIDTFVCRPLEKYKIRQALGLSTAKPIILLSAGDIADKRKGMIHAIQALQRLRPDIETLVLVVGRIADDARQMFGEIEVLETGYLRDDQMKAQYFAAADVFLFCPLDDNMPLTILETMATATPMVGYSTGGIPEIVEHMKTGYLAGKGDLDRIVQGLKLALSGDTARRWGLEARAVVERGYSHDIFVHRHLELYELMIRKFRACNAS
jgi:glycosyltransferase involved in cell wall biosynthesis